jgi:hypothetical protein
MLNHSVGRGWKVWRVGNDDDFKSYDIMSIHR